MSLDDRDLSRRFKSEAERIVVTDGSRRRSRGSSWALLRPLAATVVIAALAVAVGRGLADLRTQAPPAATAPAASPTATAEGITPLPEPSELATPSVPVLVGTGDGEVYVLGRSGLGERIFACDGGWVSRIERSPDRQSVLVLCFDGRNTTKGYVLRGDAPAISLDLAIGSPHDSAWSPDSRSIALLAPGTCTPTAPVCAMSIVSYELASGGASTLREEDVLISNLRWTPAGLAVHRGGSPPLGGTDLLQGGTWRRIADDRLVAASPDGRFLLHREIYDANRARHLVILLSNGTETVLTAEGVSERPLGFDPSGRVIALREERTGSTAIVVYDGDTVVSVTAGEFPGEAIQWNEWLIGRTHSNRIAFYSMEAGLFAAQITQLDRGLTVIGLGFE